MKTERRHELRTNELSVFLADANDWTRKHSTHLGTVVIIAVVILVGYTLVKRSRASSTDAAWQTMRELSYTLENADASFDRLDQLIADANNRDFKMIALLRKARSARNLATLQDDGFHPKYLDEAAAAYRALLNDFPDRMPVVATALDGLAWVEESRFAVDGDAAHRSEARTFLERLVSEPRFKGTPFQTDAARRLQDLDVSLQTVAMVDAPPPDPKLDGTRLDLTDSFQLSSPADYSLEVVPAAPPADDTDEAVPADEPSDEPEADEPLPESADEGGRP